MSRLRRGLLAGALLGFLVLLAIGFTADVRAVGQALAAFPWGLAPLVLAGTLFNYSLRFVKWHFYLRQIGADRISRRESARLFVAGFPLALTPGKLGEALKAVWIQGKTGIPTARALPVVAAERVSDGMAVLALSSLGVLSYPQYWPAFALLWAVLLGIVALSRFDRLVGRAVDRWAHLPWVTRLARPVTELFVGARTLFGPRPLAVAVTLGTLAWFGEGLGFFVILVGLGLPPTVETLAASVFALAFSTAVGGASTLPGGLGAAEASLTAMLTLLLRVPLDLALTATLLIRFATLWFGVALGLAAWTRSADLLGLATPDGVSASMPKSYVER